MTTQHEDIKDKMISVIDAQEKHALSPHQIWLWIRQGKLPVKCADMEKTRGGDNPLAWVNEDDLLTIIAQQGQDARILAMIRKEVRRQVKLEKVKINREKTLLTCADVAVLCDVHVNVVLQWLRAGKLPGIAIEGNRGYRIHPEDLAEFLGLPVEKIV